MGTGIDAARSLAPEHARAMDNMKDQLILVLIERLGGKVDIPVSEIDGTGGRVLMMRANPENKTFEFKIRRKQ